MPDGLTDNLNDLAMKFGKLVGEKDTFIILLCFSFACFFYKMIFETSIPETTIRSISAIVDSAIPSPEEIAAAAAGVL